MCSVLSSHSSAGGVHSTFGNRVAVRTAIARLQRAGIFGPVPGVALADSLHRQATNLQAFRPEEVLQVTGCNEDAWKATVAGIRGMLEFMRFAAAWLGAAVASVPASEGGALHGRGWRRLIRTQAFAEAVNIANMAIALGDWSGAYASRGRRASPVCGQVNQCRLQLIISRVSLRRLLAFGGEGGGGSAFWSWGRPRSSRGSTRSFRSTA